MNTIETKVATIEFTQEEVHKLEQARLVLEELIDFMEDFQYETAIDDKGNLPVEIVLDDIEAAAEVLEWLPNSNKLV